MILSNRNMANMKTNKSPARNSFLQEILFRYPLREHMPVKAMLCLKIPQRAFIGNFASGDFAHKSMEDQQQNTSHCSTFAIFLAWELNSLYVILY